MNRIKFIVGFGLLLVVESSLAQQEVTQLVTTVSRFGDWSVRCEQRNSNPESCVMNLSIVEQKSGTELVQANVARESGDTMMTLVLPLGIYLPGGVKLTVKDHGEFQFPISFCSRDGCFVNEVLEQSTVDLLRKKEQASLTIAPSKTQVVELPFSLTGFLDAFKKL
jgi:invasion protein IalB